MALRNLINELLSTLCVKSLIQYAEPTSANTSSSGLGETSEETFGFDEKLPEKSRESRGTTTDPEILRWHRFLDYLCALCQFENAGDSVIALAAHLSPRGLRFVLTVNNNLVDKPMAHLDFILDLLREVCQPGARTPQEVIVEIRNRSIKQAAKRLRQYRRLLVTLVKEAEREQHTADHEKQPVLAALQDLTLSEEQCSNSDLSCRVSAFCTTPEYRILSDVLYRRSRACQRIRHVIGRLTLWQRAAAFVTTHAPQYRDILRDAHVGSVACKPDLSKSKGWPLIGNLEELVAAVCPRIARSDVVLAETVRRLESATALLEKFQLHDQVPVVHAEAALAHHFWHKKWIFASPNAGEEDRYIGCSKPSCYSCSMYLKHHSGNFERRPAHGRAWLRWHPPVLLNIREHEKLSERKEKLRKLEEDENIRILHLMTEEMQNDVEFCIFNERYGIRADFDSTTGMS